MKHEVSQCQKISGSSPHAELGDGARHAFKSRYGLIVAPLSLTNLYLYPLYLDEEGKRRFLEFYVSDCSSHTPLSALSSQSGATCSSLSSIPSQSGRPKWRHVDVCQGLRLSSQYGFGPCISTLVANPVRLSDAIKCPWNADRLM